MKKEIYRARFETAISTDASSRSINVIASTPDVDSAGRIVIQDWDLARFSKNPVVLWNHGRGGFFGGVSDELPIGHASNVRVEDNKLHATLNFVDEKANPIAEKVFQGFLQGSLRAVSVGWETSNVERIDTGDGDVHLKLSGNKLLEISAVAIPANAEAVKEGASFVASLLSESNPPKENKKMDDEKFVSFLATLGVTSADQATGLVAGLKEKADAHDKLANELAAIKAEKKRDEIAALVALARKEGKFVPANEAKFLSIAGDNVETLRTLVDALPVVVSTEPTVTPKTNTAGVLSSRERARCKDLGISEADYLEQKRAEKETKEEDQ